MERDEGDGEHEIRKGRRDGGVGVRLLQDRDKSVGRERDELRLLRRGGGVGEGSLAGLGGNGGVRSQRCRLAVFIQLGNPSKADTCTPGQPCLRIRKLDNSSSISDKMSSVSIQSAASEVDSWEPRRFHDPNMFVFVQLLLLLVYVCDSCWGSK